MSILMVLVDYDNVEKNHKNPGPIHLARMLVGLVPVSVINNYSAVKVRFYGGWRSNAQLTRSAQKLIPDIRQGAPGVYTYSFNGTQKNLRFFVELADRPIGSATPIEESYVLNRSIRNFRTLAFPWGSCADHIACGLSQYISAKHDSNCANSNCSTRLSDLLVRDEQKMVDTLIVADIAHETFVSKANNVVVVSSDTDMWPGVMLALNAGCNIIHIHTKRSWKTQRHLLNTLTHHHVRAYTQLSV